MAQESGPAKEVREALELLEAIHPGSVGAVFNKHYLAALGENYAPMYDGVKNEAEAEKKLNAYINNLKKRKPFEALYLLQALKVPDNSIAIPGGSRWYNEGLPLIRLTKEQVEDFVAWVPTEEAVDAIKPAFHAFFIELPEKVLFVEDLNKMMIPAVGIFVHTILLEEDRLPPGGRLMKAGLKWRVVITTDSPTVQWQMDRSLRDLTGLEPPANNSWFGLAGQEEPSEYDELLNRAAAHIVCCVCKMMESREDIKVTRTTEKVIFPEEEYKARREAGGKGEVYYTVYERAL